MKFINHYVVWMTLEPFSDFVNLFWLSVTDVVAMLIFL